MSDNDSVGVDLYSPPVVGRDYPDYWENTIAGWVLKTNTVAVDFGAVMQAEVPEPSSIALSLAGGIAVLLFANRSRRSS